VDSTTLRAGHGTEPFRHLAMFYRDDRQYLDELVPFVRDGLERGHPVAAAVPGDRLRLLGDALGPAANQLWMIDMVEAGRNPGRIIPGVLRAFADANHGTPMRVVVEPVWPGRTAAEYPACVQHEALINTAFRGSDATILCPYDATGLSELALRDAGATHPLLHAAGAHRCSKDFAPQQAHDRYNRPLPAEPGAAQTTVRTSHDLAAVRAFVIRHGHVLGLAADRVADLELIACELVTNSLLHGSGSCLVRIWRAGPRVVACEVHDAGPIGEGPAARRGVRPVREVQEVQAGGGGLMLVHHLADLVRVHTGAGGTTVRVHCRLPCGRRRS
jgi:anti-sigma regulatory factor (Ser/Thr protein kinase)